MPVAIAAVKSSTRQSRLTSSALAVDGPDISSTSSRAPHCANSRPSTVPQADSSALSASSCRAIRQRDAPSATRTLSSCRRALARASSRFAMLAHAISSTSATTAMMM